MRPYQIAAVEACREALVLAGGRAIIAMPPGTGAMHTAVAVIAVVEAPVSLVLVHRRDQLYKAMRQLQMTLPNAMVGVIEESSSPVLLQEVLVATVACARRLVAAGHLRLDDIGLVVLDECHRSVGPLLNGYEGRLLGLTDLVDQQTLDRLRVLEPCFVYSFAQAVRDGFLVPFRVNTSTSVPVMAHEGIWTDPSDFEAAGELDLPFGRWFVFTDLARRVAYDLIQHLPKADDGLPGGTVVVVPDQSAAQIVVEALNEAFGVPGIAASITSGSTEAGKTAERFCATRLPRLAVIVDQHEAVSSPDVSAVVLLRPVRSPRLFRSLLGIGARPAAGKTSFTVFDYVGAFEWHRLDFE